MRTQARNYRKNPHTATFLQTFHSGIGSNAARENAKKVLADALAAGVDGREPQARPADSPMAREARCLECNGFHRGGASCAPAADDLLNLVPDNKIVDYRTPAQVKFMEDLISRITQLDAEAGRIAREYTDGMTERGLWTPGRGGKSSIWIDKMIAKERDLRNAVKTTPAPAPQVEIPAGRYAVETDQIRCYTVDYGKTGTRWEGFVFLNRISSDDRFPIRNPATKAEILAAIAADVTASAILAGLTLRQCRRCGRELSDTKNPYFPVALGPDCGAK